MLWVNYLLIIFVNLVDDWCFTFLYKIPSWFRNSCSIISSTKDFENLAIIPRRYHKALVQLVYTIDAHFYLTINNDYIHLIVPRGRKVTRAAVFGREVGILGKNRYLFRCDKIFYVDIDCDELTRYINESGFRMNCFDFAQDVFLKINLNRSCWRKIFYRKCYILAVPFLELLLFSFFEYIGSLQ